MKALITLATLLTIASPVMASPDVVQIKTEDGKTFVVRRENVKCKYGLTDWDNVPSVSCKAVGVIYDLVGNIEHHADLNPLVCARDEDKNGTYENGAMMHHLRCQAGKRFGFF